MHSLLGNQRRSNRIDTFGVSEAGMHIMSFELWELSVRGNSKRQHKRDSSMAVKTRRVGDVASLFARGSTSPVNASTAAPTRNENREEFN